MTAPTEYRMYTPSQMQRFVADSLRQEAGRLVEEADSLNPYRGDYTVGARHGMYNAASILRARASRLDCQAFMPDSIQGNHAT